MKTEILKRTIFEKANIIGKLYFSACWVFMITLYILIFFFFIPEDIKIKIFTHKRALLEISSTSFRNISLFFIGTVIGSYSIVQALLDEESLEVLTTPKNGQSSKFTYINIYFYSYVIILLLAVVINGTIEIMLKVETILGYIAILKISKRILENIFIVILFFQIAFMFSISYEFKVFIRNLYDTFKVTTYIKMTKLMNTKEKVLFINTYLFNNHKINYLGSSLTKEAYEEMKIIIGKDFTLDEAITYIKENS
ncbi:hypothetical protein DXA30_02815 [Fusobacterium ulcerans]|uniref:hypothetical protein n=1 Tax=Fusobacterium ulcerans TaxID=861 RepID=UPI000E4908EF|nr:hypothetical protein [Fusobacterium ulcerans]RGY66702.1 hypothetical protein DXA30_02815 [Fusobacterium ulcerans]